MKSNPVSNNLPLQLSSFIGREQEIAEVARLLAESRLVTLTGAGGCGKTRLALQVASELCRATPADQYHCDGIWFIELASLANPALVPQEVASALDVRELPGQPLLSTLAEALRDKQLLLILDNCEHLIEACAQLADTLLRASAGLHILSTSREPLSISGETTYRVPSLPAPPPGSPLDAAQLEQYDAVRLFVVRAQAAQPHFVLTAQHARPVAEICSRLDGIPLAIELAAARLKHMSVAQIALRLDDRFHLLTGGKRTALPRHRTLGALIDWSYDLLSEPERLLLRRLAVFVGGWTLEAAEQVCALDAGTPPTLALSDVLDLLSQLVDKSLVVAEARAGSGAAMRYRMLETIRQYAGEKLRVSGEEMQARDRHLEFFVRFAEEADSQWRASEPLTQFRRLEAEQDNLRAALDWTFQNHHAETGLRLAAALARFWFYRGYLTEARRWLDEALTARSGTNAALRAKALHWAGRAALRLQDYEAASAWFQESLTIRRELGDKDGIATAFYYLGAVASYREGHELARSFFQEGLAMMRVLGNRGGSGLMLNGLGMVSFIQQDNASARKYFEECLPLLREAGDQRTIALVLNNLGSVFRRQGDFETACALMQESLAIKTALGEEYILSTSLGALGQLCADQAQPERAARLLGAQEALLAGLRSQIEPYSRSEHERTLAAVRAQLGDDAFNVAWAEGCRMTLEQAVAEARLVTADEPTTRSEPAAPPAYPAGLTEREVEVLRWLARGLTDAEIAEQLVIGRRTVNSHLRTIYSKLDVTTRTAAVRYALDHKLV